MIKSRGASGEVIVTFTLPAVVGATSVAVCGEWNDWSPDEHALERAGDEWVGTVELEPGRAYRFRYLLDGHRWENDWAADAYVANDHGGDDSVVDLTALVEEVPPAGTDEPTVDAGGEPAATGGTAGTARKAAAPKKAARKATAAKQAPRRATGAKATGGKAAKATPTARKAAGAEKAATAVEKSTATRKSTAAKKGAATKKSTAEKSPDNKATATKAATKATKKATKATRKLPTAPSESGGPAGS